MHSLHPLPSPSQLFQSSPKEGNFGEITIDMGSFPKPKTAAALAEIAAAGCCGSRDRSRRALRTRGAGLQLHHSPALPFLTKTVNLTQKKVSPSYSSSPLNPHRNVTGAAETDKVTPEGNKFGFVPIKVSEKPLNLISEKCRFICSNCFVLLLIIEGLHIIMSPLSFISRYLNVIYQT